MIRNIILPIFALVLLASCSGKEKGNNSQNASTEAIPVKVQKLEKTNIANTVEQTANLIADEQVYYAPASTGRIKQIHVEVGDRIKKGEVLVEMDQTNLVQAEVQLENLKAEYNRAVALNETNSISKQAYDAAVTQYEVAKSNYEFLKENTQMLAPFDGIVTGKYFENGEVYTGIATGGASKPAIITIEKINDARRVLKEAIYPTDVIHTNKLTDRCKICLKAENLQKTGSFKIRGAYYKIARLSPEEKQRGVIACSAGNHAQGVALAAQKNGIPALICLPDGAPISKVEATRSYGAELCLVPGVYDDAYQRALQLQKERQLTFIHPFDDEDVIAGQGTIGLEILDQLEDVDAIVVPVGGGGLISGIAFAVKQINPKVKVYGVQAAGAPSMIQSLEHNKIEMLPSVSTIADGIAVKEPGVHTFELCRKYVDGVVSVTDDQVSAAILALIEKQKMIAEGAGAVSLAAVMFGKIPDIKGKKVVCLISGGNIDVTILSRVINRGLLMSGRTTTLTVELMDKPGQLTQLLTAIAETGANIFSVNHDRMVQDIAVSTCIVDIVAETRNKEHSEQMIEAIKAKGFQVL